MNSSLRRKFVNLFDRKICSWCSTRSSGHQSSQTENINRLFCCQHNHRCHDVLITELGASADALTMSPRLVKLSTQNPLEQQQQPELRPTQLYIIILASAVSVSWKFAMILSISAKSSTKYFVFNCHFYVSPSRKYSLWLFVFLSESQIAHLSSHTTSVDILSILFNNSWYSISKQLYGISLLYQSLTRFPVASFFISMSFPVVQFSHCQD